SSKADIDDFPNPAKSFDALRCIVSKQLEVMVHVFPGFKDHIRPLGFGALSECLNAVKENLGAASLHINRRKAAEVSPQQGYERIATMRGRTVPVSPLLQHSLLKPVELCVPHHAGAVVFELNRRGKRNGHGRWRKFRTA